MTRVRKVDVCAVEGCGPQVINGRGLCGRHYARWRKYGDPTTLLPVPSLMERIEAPTQRRCRACKEVRRSEIRATGRRAT